MQRTAICVCCKSSFFSKGNRGPVRKCCEKCHDARKSALGKLRYEKAGKPAANIKKTCVRCGRKYLAHKQSQKYCSRDCMGLAGRKRSQCVCSNPGCKASFEKKTCDVTASNYCCIECFRQHKHGTHSRFCFGCGRLILRHSQNNPEKDALKYCSKECFFNHRWGLNRPRVRRKNKYAAGTSLRVRCKRLGVYHDKSCKREAIFERDSYKCQLCGIKCNREYKVLPGNRICRKNAELDHIIPLSKDGSPGHTWENCQCLCRSCNMNKRDRLDGNCQMRLALQG